jgi:hypothetical protein
MGLHKALQALHGAKYLYAEPLLVNHVDRAMQFAYQQDGDQTRRQNEENTDE